MSETAMSLYDRMADPVDAITKLGRMFAESGMFGCQKTEQGQVLAMACLSERKSPTELLRVYHLIQGKLAMKSEAMLAGLIEKGGSHVVVERTSEKASIKLTRGANSTTFTLTWSEAEQEPFVWQHDKAGKRVLKDKYATPISRKQMLWARVVSDAVRAIAPDVICGSLSDEEAEDIGVVPRELNLAPAKTVVVAAKTPEAVEVGEAVWTPTLPVSKTGNIPEKATTVPRPIESEPLKLIAVKDPNGAGIDEQTVLALKQLVGVDNIIPAMDYLLSRGWIPKDGKLGDLSVANAQKIFNKTPEFLAKIGVQTTQPAA